MLILGIETTCDETSCAVVRQGKEILSNVVTSQIDLHREFGGVVPELACRRHVDVILPVLREALDRAQVSLEQIDLIAVAYGPGLIGALLIGVYAAKTLAWALQKPLIGINHIEAHLYAALMSHDREVVFPCVGAVLSGGHTSLVLIKDIGEYQLIGQTVDDAIGEAFDKVAKILGLPYPGGPQIEALAKLGNPRAYSFKPGHVKGAPYDFSFSGLKTAVLYAAKGQKGDIKGPLQITEDQKADMAASFQETALGDVVKKTLLAAENFGCKTLVFGGGVTCNAHLRQMFEDKGPHNTYLWPRFDLCLDNAAMIGGLGYHRFLKQGSVDNLDLEAKTEISFSMT